MCQCLSIIPATIICYIVYHIIIINVHLNTLNCLLFEILYFFLNISHLYTWSEPSFDIISKLIYNEYCLFNYISALTSRTESFS